MGKKKLSSSIQERRKKRLNTIPLVSRNRFEVHVNRSKHNILGKKEKHDRGVPGISRSKANEKRKKTLLVKYKQRNKSNVMIDKRFGEFDETVSAEEKMLKRFTLEKQSHHVKVGHYNIEEDEELTHYGQNLADISNFDEIELGEEDEYDNGDMFGGLLMKKKKDNQWEETREDRKLTRQEIMHEIIVDSKRDKHERQKTKQLSFELTQKLDTEWKQIHPMLTKRSDKNSTNTVKEKQDDYDKIVNELLFEAKGKPTERLKSVEEIAKEEARRQAKMEKQRIDRMKMVDEDESIHQSADALIVKLPKKVDERYMLQFRDGQMVKPEGFDEKNDELENENEMIDSDNENNDDGHDDSGEDDDQEECTDGDDTDNEDVFSDEEVQDKVVDDDSNSTEDEEIDGEDNAAEVEADTNELELSVKRNRNIKTKKNKTKIVVKNKTKKDCTTDGKRNPYNFEVPENVDNLLDAIQITKSDIYVLLPKIRRINIGNKKNLEKLFNIILEYIEHTCIQPQPSMQCLNNLGGIIQQLVQDIPVYVTKAIQLKLRDMLKRIMKCMKHKHYSEIFPTLSELTLFKIVELIFPTSDLNHVITTPCLFTIALILTKARFTTIKSILSGILLLEVVYNYVKLSKRYLPELIAFLTRLFYQAVPVNLPLKKITSSVLNMKSSECGFLYISDRQDVKLCAINISLLSPSCEIDSFENDSFRLSSIRNMLLLTEKFCNLYIELETFNEIVEPVLFLLELLPVDNYPTSLKDLHQKLLTVMQSKSSDEKAPLKLQTRKPIPLTLLEPQFEEVNENLFSKHSGDKVKNEHDKLKYKVKKELKGALREIRKDTHYLAKQQLGEKLDKDATRKRKVKELKSALENETREIREMEKGSKSKK